MEASSWAAPVQYFNVVVWCSQLINLSCHEVCFKSFLDFVQFLLVFHLKSKDLT